MLRRRRSFTLKRGKFWGPALPQGQQSQPYPNVTEPAGPRPRWLPRLRRGKTFEPPWPQGQQTQPFPGWVDQSGSRPRWAPRPRRGRIFSPPWPQGVQGQPYPTVTDPAGSRPKWLPRLRRGRFAEPPWPQGVTSQPYPGWVDQSGPRPKWLPKLRRGQTFSPPWPQGTLSQPYPSVIRPAGTRPRWAVARRGRIFAPPWSTPVVGMASFTDPAGSRPRWAPKLRRSRYFEPPWPQGPAGVPLASFTTPSGARPRWAALRRGRLFPLPVPPVAAVPLPQLVQATRRRLTPIRRARFAEPAWVQGPQRQPIVGFLRQSGRVRVAAPRRGSFTPPVAVVVSTYTPSYLTVRRRSAPTVRHARFVEPPWVLPTVPRLLVGRRAAPGLARRGRLFAAPTPVATWVPAPTVRRRTGLVAARRGRHASLGFGQAQQGVPYPTMLVTRRPTPRPVRRGAIGNLPWAAIPPARVLVYAVGRVLAKWFTGTALPARWTLGTATRRWNTGRLLVLSIPVVSTEYVRVGPVSATSSGQPVNPTGDPVALAFLASPSAEPTSGDWHTAIWDTPQSGLYVAQCLVGPLSSVVLVAGTYYVWIKLVDQSETIIRQVDTLTIV